jgi:hypothetical protein
MTMEKGVQSDNRFDTPFPLNYRFFDTHKFI